MIVLQIMITKVLGISHCEPAEYPERGQQNPTSSIPFTLYLHIEDLNYVQLHEEAS